MAAQRNEWSHFFNQYQKFEFYMDLASLLWHLFCGLQFSYLEKIGINFIVKYSNKVAHSFACNNACLKCICVMGLQIKCYMQQLLCGLEHCHSRGVLHRDIKGSNLLIDDNGVLKIGDFGLANFYDPDQKQPLTSRVVTLWYRAPELLLGATEYGAAIDLWSTGCILAELFYGKPIMPGRTEVISLLITLVGSYTYFVGCKEHHCLCSL